MKRTRTVLKKNCWADEIALAIWNAKKMKHAFNFKNHHLTTDGKRGTLSGKLANYTLNI